MTTYMSRMTLKLLDAEWHDATPVCMDGFSCWVASVTTRHPAAERRLLAVSEQPTEAEARSWALAELARLAGVSLDAVRALAPTRRIEAIRLVRDCTGCTLIEAQALVEALQPAGRVEEPEAWVEVVPGLSRKVSP